MNQISSEEMLKRLAGQFEKARPAACGKCVVPKTFWGPSAGPGTGYWYMEKPAHCGHGCDSILAKLWADMTSEHQIAKPVVLSEAPR
jgi:hypothetical protein